MKAVARFLVLASSTLAIAATPALARQAQFIPLGQLPGSHPNSVAHGVSADGSVVVGGGDWFVSTLGAAQAFQWTAAGGMVGLGFLPNHQSSWSTAVSADGSVAVGYSTTSFPLDAMRWTAAGGMVSLGAPAGSSSWASAVNSDGSVIVGAVQSSGVDEAFRWTAGGGLALLGAPPGGSTQSVAQGVSSDGSVVVGGALAASAFDEAFRWTAAGGRVGLGLLAGGVGSSSARAVNADGSVVVGYSASPIGDQAFRWTAAGGMVGLGALPNASWASYATGVSADGSVIVGTAYTSTGNVHPFLWTQSLGMVDLRDHLIARGAVNAAGWELRAAHAISADGRAIVGGGVSLAGGGLEAWRALLPPWAPTAFCTAGTTAHGCVPSISASGTPSASAASGFTVTVDQVEGQRSGLIFYGLDNTGFAPLPWGSGTSYLCIQPPTQRMPVQSSGGNVNQCDGVLSIDWLAFLATHPGVLGWPATANQGVFAQAWFRDPPSAKHTGLSNALEWLLEP